MLIDQLTLLHRHCHINRQFEAYHGRMGISLYYRRHRFHPSVIQVAVRLTYRFTLVYRDVEAILSGRGIDVSFETVRRWCLKFGPIYARRMRRKRSRPSTVWYIDEVFPRIADRHHYLWRVVDAEGEVLDVLLQSQRNKAAAVLEAFPSAEHDFGKHLNN